MRMKIPVTREEFYVDCQRHTLHGSFLFYYIEWTSFLESSFFGVQYGKGLINNKDNFMPHGSNPKLKDPEERMRGLREALVRRKR